MAKMSELSTHEQQETALSLILAAHERGDAIDELYATAKLIAADTCDADLAEGFDAVPLVNSDGFHFKLS